jgi:hypothetical protein
MIMAIKFLVNGSVFYPKIGAKIDNTHARGQQRFGELGGQAVGQRKKNKTHLARDLFWVRIGKLERGRSFLVREARKNLHKRFAGQLPRRCCDQLDPRMREE